MNHSRRRARRDAGRAHFRLRPPANMGSAGNAALAHSEQCCESRPCGRWVRAHTPSLSSSHDSGHRTRDIEDLCAATAARCHRRGPTPRLGRSRCAASDQPNDEVDGFARSVAVGERVAESVRDSAHDRPYADVLRHARTPGRRQQMPRRSGRCGLRRGGEVETIDQSGIDERVHLHDDSPSPLRISLSMNSPRLLRSVSGATNNVSYPIPRP